MEFIRYIHVGCVVLTLLFFTGRGITMMRDPSVTGKKWVRRTAELIDTTLFFSGIALIYLTNQNPWQDGWLAAKMSALLGYIFLGMVAFHWAKRLPLRISAWAGALLVFGYMVAVALTRNPWPPAG